MVGARLGKYLLIAAAGVVVFATLAVLAAHTPWARARALSWASRFVTRYHLDLEAGSLGYNALTRRVTLTDVRLAAEGHHDRPFFVASRIEVHLPWSVFQRRFAIDQLTIRDAIVDIVRDEHNVVNLPPGSNGPSPVQPRRLNLRALAIEGLDVQYEDRFRNWGVSVPRIASDLRNTASGASGTFAVRGPLRMHQHERVMNFAPFETGMTFDGSNVMVDHVALSSPEIEAVLAGRIDRVLDSTTLDLAVQGSVNLVPALKWVPPAPVDVGGAVAIEGRIAGPAHDFGVDLKVNSRTLDVGRERALTLAGPVSVTFNALSGENVVITLASGGSIRAAFTVPWGHDTVSTATAEWNGLDAQAALQLANVDPQAIGATFNGRGTFTFSEPHRFVIANQSVGKTGRGVVPMTGTVSATIIGDDYTFDHAHSFPGFDFEGRMSGRINHAVAMQTTMSGPARATVSDVASAATSAETLGFPVAAIMHQVHGDVAAPMTLGGTYREPQVDTQLTSHALDVPLLGRVRAAAHVVADTHAATISGIELGQGANTITGNAVANITRRAWSGDLHVSAPDAAAFQSSVPEAWRVSGPMTADATLGGTFDVTTLDSIIRGTNLVWAGQAIDRVTAKGLVSTDGIDVSSIELHQGAGFMDGRVRYAWDSGAYSASLKGDRLSWRGTLLSPNDTQALLAVQFAGEGTSAQPRGQGRIDFALAGGAAGAFIGSGEATVDLLGDLAKIAARLPDLGATINAEVATSTPYDYRMAAQLDRFELQRLSPFLGAVETEILGFANGTITASGHLANQRDRAAFVNVTELDAGIGGVPVTLNAPLNAELRGDDVSLKDVFVRVGSGRLGASGEWNTWLNGTFRAQFAGDFQDVVRMSKAFGLPATFDGSGPMSFDVQSNGSRTGTRGTLAINKGTFNWGRGPAAVQDLAVTAALDGEQLTLERVSGNVASGGVIGSFSAKGSARIPQATLAAIDGSLVLDGARFTFSGIPVEQQRPSRIDLSKGTLSMSDVSWLVAENPVTFGGSVGLVAANPTLDLAVNGVVDLRVLSAFTSTVAFDGSAGVETRIGGTVSQPQLIGRMVLDDAEVAISEPRLILDDLAGEIVLKGQVATFNNVHGLANGGALTLDGPVEFANMTLSGGALNIQAQGVAVEMPRGLRSELDALVTFRPDPRNPLLTGDIRVAQSAYTDTITIAAFARQAASPVSPSAAERPYLDRLQFNLAVTTTEDITVDNNYGRLAAGADVRLVGTAANPGMEGRITLREGGQIFLAGRTFRITRGDISFTDRRHIHPEFNIAADANLGAGTGNVTMTLTGTLERPTIDLTSEQGSRTPSEIAAQLVGTSNGDLALTLLSADLLGVTGRAIGLDAFRVERGAFHDTDFDYLDDPTLVGTSQTDPTTRLTVGKRLSDQVEFTVSQNLRENGKATVIVSYFPKSNVELRGISRDTGTLAVSARHQVTFGGGVRKAAVERRVRPKITAVTVNGPDPSAFATARRGIKLGVGDEFDFLKLQRDVDRIRDDFSKLGHFEARVRTRRTDAADGASVAIDFVVDPGPKTVLALTGLTPPPALVAELQEAWHKNTFDQFLIDDLTHRVRRHLVTSGDLGSIVVGRIDRPSPDIKRLRIDVTPGAPVTGREIRFTGNVELESARLLAEIQRAGVEVEAWLDRAVAERVLRDVYTEEGFLKAQVSGQPQAIDDTTGILLFDIVEGPRAQITDVKWAGVAAARQADVEKAAALSTPAPFLAGTMRDALGRVEDWYRSQGFNSADVEAQPAASDDDMVTVTFTIAEGPQQVLRNVEVTGNDLTNQKVVNEALHFELGKPVDLDEWAKARKRLYDTNVFRLVDIQPIPAAAVSEDGKQPVKAIVHVEEYPRWSFRYGFQLEGERQAQFDEFTSTKNLGVVAELRTPNLFGRALNSGVFGLYERDRHDTTVYLATSRLFGWAARSTLYGFYSRDLLRDEQSASLGYVTDRQGISVDQRWRPKGFQIVYGYRFERNHTFDPDPGNDPLPLDVLANLAKLSSAALFDHRDDPINPRRGSFSSVSYDEAAPFLGSDVQNRKLLMQQFAFFPLGKVVFASRAQAGFAFGPDELLPSDRFRAGGATSVRGYGEDSLGPRNAVGVPSGGERLLILNQEARFPMYRWIGGVLFVDAGNIFAKAGEWNGLKVGYGMGLRVNTPVGLLRADIGFPKTIPASGRGTRYYFGIGHIF